MNDVTNITLNADGTFADAKGKELTLKQVINMARVRRDATNAAKKAERDAAKTAKSAAKRAKLEARAAKLVDELKSLGTDQKVIDGLVAKLSA
jgi:hypothetical protein